MQRRHLLRALPSFALRFTLRLILLLVLLSPTARRASATPPDKQTPAPSPPAKAEVQRPVESKPAPEADAAAVVEKQLVKPLAEKEARRNRFSRAYIPPQARRVRVQGGQRPTDGRGAEFVAFAVDERSGKFVPRTADDTAHWRQDAIVGCVYPARDEVFIKRGDRFFGAGLLLGQKAAAADDTICRPAPVRIPPGAVRPPPAA